MATSDDTSKDGEILPPKADTLPKLEPVEGEEGSTEEIVSAEGSDRDLETAVEGAENDAEIIGDDALTDAADVVEEATDDAVDTAEDIADAELASDAVSDDVAETIADEPVAEAVSEPVPVAPAPEKRRGGFMGGLFGGVLAACGLYGAGQYQTQEWPFAGGTFDLSNTGVAEVEEAVDYQSEIDSLRTELASTTEALEASKSEMSQARDVFATAQSEIDALREDLSGATAQVTDLTALVNGLPTGGDASAGGEAGGFPAEVQALLESQAEELGAQTEQIEAQATQISELTARLDAMPQLTAGDLPDEVQALLDEQRDQIVALQSEIETATTAASEIKEVASAQIATAEQIKAEAEEAAKRAEARGGLNTLNDAIANGGSFADALPLIEPVAEVPEALNAVADTGVETMQSLQNAFPEAARVALSTAARADAGEGVGDRLKLFMSDQLGARSLSPKDGDGADAILSRAEAAVKAGDLSGAVELVTALPEPAGEAFAEWLANAQARLDAQGALGALTDALSAD